VLRSLFVTLALALAFAAQAHATECVPSLVASPALAKVDAETRLAFLERRLERASHNAKIWTGTWAGVFSALTIGGAVLIPLVEKGARVDYYFTAGKSLVGLASLGVVRLRAIGDARWLRSRSRTDACALVADAERLLVRSAKSENEGRTLVFHVGNLALNMGSLLVLGLVFDRWDSAALQGVGGSVIGELMIATRPRTAEDALDAYRGANLGAAAKRDPIPVAVYPLVLHQGGGLAVSGSF